MNAVNTYSLIQFNTPNHLRDKLNSLSVYRRIPRSAMINQVLDTFVRDQFEIIEKDGRFHNLIEVAQKTVTKPKVSPPIPEMDSTRSHKWETSYS
jgi:hypothetical protein